MFGIGGEGNRVTPLLAPLLVASQKPDLMVNGIKKDSQGVNSGNAAKQSYTQYCRLHEEKQAFFAHLHHLPLSPMLNYPH